MVTLHGDKPVVKVIDFGIAKATQDLFARALELPEAERDTFLPEACGDDAEC